MSRYFSEKYAALEPYTPGEQPRDTRYIKLNTNESPYPPSPAVAEAVTAQAGLLQLYSDPTCRALREKLARHLGLSPANLIITNGSDEALNFIFMAYGDETHPFVFPDITYGFYPVFCRLNGVPCRELPLMEDFSVPLGAFSGAGANIVLANPNAPTGLPLTAAEIEGIVQANREHIVVIDEAYVDFGGESCLGLIGKYDNLLVVRTFSKSRSMAGARLGFAAGNPALIADLETLRYSTNPYNVNRMTLAAGEAALSEDGYYRANCEKILSTRDLTAGKLRELGFEVLPSAANFLFIRHPDITGLALYQKLKARGVLIRHFERERIAEYNRLTIGTPEDMETFLKETEAILSE